MAALAYKGDPHGFLPWLVQQPKMDRATAGWIFLWAEGSRYLRGATDFSFNSGVRDAGGLLSSICERSHGTGFSNDALGLDRDFEAERLKCLAVIQNGELAPGIVAPMVANIDGVINSVLVVPLGSPLAAGALFVAGIGTAWLVGRTPRKVMGDKAA